MKAKLLVAVSLFFTANLLGGCTSTTTPNAESLPPTNIEAATEAVSLEAAEKNIEDVNLDTDFPYLTQSDLEK